MSQATAIVVPENLYQILVDGVADYAIYMLDPNGTVISWNSGAQRFKGYKPEEIIGQNFARFYTPEDRACGLPQHALATAAREGRYEKEGWRVRKDGERFWAHVVIDPIRSSAGELIGYAKITRDLTERKMREETLHRSEEQFQLLVRSVTDYAIYMLDPTGRVSSWNLGAERIKGYLPEEIIGQHFSQFYTPEDQAAGAPKATLDTASREGRFETEGWRLRKDGSRFWAHVVVDAIHDDAGGVVGFAKITRDMTERKAAQRALDEAREALFQAQKMEAIGQLTGGVAHDFNNLLMAILGSLELVQRRLPDDDPAISRLINNAIMGAQRGASLTQRMLAFARRQDLKLEAVDAPSLIVAMAELMERSLGPSIDVETRFAPGLPRVHTDPVQLESAILNLALNARDAMPEGGVITIAAAAATLGDGDIEDLAAGDYVCVSVTDPGEGMDEDTLAKATEPFFTSKGVGKGTGLGLSMVHGVVRQSGGALRLSSKRGHGTRVELWLPVSTSNATVQARAVDQPDTSQGPLRILLVDDDSLVLMNSSEMLEELGHTVIKASSPAKALKLLRADEAIDLLITDQAMPGMTGLQLAQVVQAERPGLPIILATGYAELPPGVDVKFQKLAKPFGLTDLATALAATPRVAVS